MNVRRILNAPVRPAVPADAKTRERSPAAVTAIRGNGAAGVPAAWKIVRAVLLLPALLPVSPAAAITKVPVRAACRAIPLRVHGLRAAGVLAAWVRAKNVPPHPNPRKVKFAAAITTAPARAV